VSQGDPAGSSSPAGERSTLSADYQRDWPQYFDAVAGKPPRDTLTGALDAFEREHAAGPAKALPLAVDLGCGDGRDSRAILARENPTWRVLALDSHPEAIRRCVTLCSPEHAARLAAAQLAMEAVATNPTTAALARARGVLLVNASFALPFCTPEGFEGLWAWVCGALRPGGRFCGQFFGERDEWACVRPKSHRTRAQVLALLDGFTLERFDEVQREGDDATGKPKWHHVFHVVARRG